MSLFPAATAPTKSFLCATFKLYRVLLIWWAGSLWSLAAWVAPTVFALVADRHTGGLIAARLFSIETYVGLGVALFATAMRLNARFAWGYGAVAILAINEWLVKLALTAARNHGTALGLGFGPWHGISAIIYLAACLCTLVSVWKQDFR